VNTDTHSQTTPTSKEDFDSALNSIKLLRDGLKAVIKGRDDTIDLVLTALAADGHVLLEDYPGSGKTTLTKTLGNLIEKDGQEADSSLIAAFRRIQFTPDMLPGDVLGVTIFEPATGAFKFKPGPVFAHVVLADEINRTGPKVQAAFLECMAEKQVTIDNKTHLLDDFFFVIGTQNPLDMAGTYPLPLVQLDRFLLKIPMQYVKPEVEMAILETHDQIVDSIHSQKPVCSRGDVLHIRRAAASVSVHKRIREAIVSIMQATRESPLLQFGASTRSALMLQQALRATALVKGRDHAVEDDLKFIAPYVLGHRLRFHGNAQSQRELLNELLLPHIERLVRSGL
jgi:MoxR-like ATPase